MIRRWVLFLFLFSCKTLCNVVYARFVTRSNSEWTLKGTADLCPARSNAVGSKSIQPSIVITTRRRYLSSPSSFTYEHTLSYSLHLARRKIIIIENTKQKKSQKVDFSRFSSKLSSPPKGTRNIRETFQMWRILYFRSGSS